MQEPIVSKSVDAKMTSNVQEDAAENSGSSALASSNIIFVLGGPGSGKGTQCDKILKKCGPIMLLSLSTVYALLQPFILVQEQFKQMFFVRTHRLDLRTHNG